jgi:hypothetical protein
MSSASAALPLRETMVASIRPVFRFVNAGVTYSQIAVCHPAMEAGIATAPLDIQSRLVGG